MNFIFATFRRLFRNEWVLIFFLLLICSFPLSLSARLSECFGDLLMKIAIIAGGRTASSSGEVVIIDARHKNGAKRGFASTMDAVKKTGAKLLVMDSGSAKMLGIYDGARQSGEPVAMVVPFNFIPTLSEMGNDSDRSALKSGDSLERLSFPSVPGKGSLLKGMLGVESTQILPSPSGYIRQGFENIFPDERGVISTALLAVRFADRAFPSLALSSFAAWKGFTPIISEDMAGLIAGVRVGNTLVRTSSDASVRINFKRFAGSFPSISLNDIVDEKAPPNLLRDKILIISSTSSVIMTPVGEMTPAELQSSVVENLIHDEFIKSFREWKITIPAMALAGIIFLISISKLKGTRKIYVSAAASALIACISIAALIVFNLMLPGMEIASFIMLAAIASTAWRYLFADNSQKKLSQAFGWRLGREAIERLSKKPELVSTSTRAREGSALVLDIKAFGKISELGSEDDFRNFLIDYRTITTGIITRRGGFIESWSADECTAIFGAPVPLKNDALQAALSAVEIKKAAESHTEAWRHKFGIEKVRVGIGISRGKIISSDFGLGFGFAGSAIEGAKQLNRLNRLYKTWGLASGTVVSETEKELEYRTLDPVKIWGIQNPSVIFEIVGESGTLLPSIRGYEEARDAYLQGNFTKAAELFSRILEFHPNDGPSKLFCRRSIAMASNPPEKWGGVWKQ